MATVFKSITYATRFKAGGRTFIVANVELGTEYPAKGVVIKATDLGLTTIEAALPLSEVLLAAEGVEAFAPSIVFGEAEIKVQVFGSGAAKKEAAFELADKNGSVSGGKITILVVGT